MYSQKGLRDSLSILTAIQHDEACLNAPMYKMAFFECLPDDV
jgi:hypothetical protein